MFGSNSYLPLTAAELVEAKREILRYPEIARLRGNAGAARRARIATDWDRRSRISFRAGT